MNNLVHNGKTYQYRTRNNEVLIITWDNIAISSHVATVAGITEEEYTKLRASDKWEGVTPEMVKRYLRLTNA